MSLWLTFPVLSSISALSHMAVITTVFTLLLKPIRLFLPQGLWTCSSYAWLTFPHTPSLSRPVSLKSMLLTPEAFLFPPQNRFDSFTLAKNSHFPYNSDWESQCCINKIKGEVCPFHVLSFAKLLPSSVYVYEWGQTAACWAYLLLVPGGACAWDPPLTLSQHAEKWAQNS